MQYDIDMTAREKFEARLKELDLYDAWLMEDHVGKVLDDGTIVVMIHVESDPTDTYTEIRYPSFEKIRGDKKSVEKIKKEFYNDFQDDHFVADLARWLESGFDCKCPLYPVDLYWAGIDGEWIDFEDDVDNGFTESVVAMLRYIARETGRELVGKINNVEL